MGIDRKNLNIACRAAALFLFVAAVIYLSFRYAPMLAELPARQDDIKALGAHGVAIFILIQIFQVVVAAIPGEAVQIAGGYIYGTFWGTVYLLIGAGIGSGLVFFLARLLGFRLVRIMAPKEKLDKFYNLLNGPKSELIIFLLFLTPGLPKDVLTYIAGLTPIRPGRFIVLALAGRLPALAASCYIGANFQRENYTAGVTVLAAGIILFCLGLIYKDRILERIRRGTDSI